MKPTTLDKIKLPSEATDTWIKYENAYICKDNGKLKCGGKIDYHIKHYLNIPTFYVNASNIHFVVYVKNGMLVSFYQYEMPPWAYTHPPNYVKFSVILKDLKIDLANRV